MNAAASASFEFPTGSTSPSRGRSGWWLASATVRRCAAATSRCTACSSRLHARRAAGSALWSWSRNSSPGAAISGPQASLREARGATRPIPSAPPSVVAAAVAGGVADRCRSPHRPSPARRRLRLPNQPAAKASPRKAPSAVAGVDAGVDAVGAQPSVSRVRSGTAPPPRTSNQPARQPRPVTPQRPDGVSDTVTVFVRSGDPASEATLRYLDQRGVTYTKRDVLSDPSATAILFGRLGRV